MKALGFSLFALLAAVCVPLPANAQFSMPLQRFDAFNDGFEDLGIGVSWEAIPNQVWAGNNSDTIDAYDDYDVVTSGKGISDGNISAQADGEGSTQASINSTTSSGDIDTAIAGSLICTPPTTGPTAGWQMGIRGDTAYQLLAHPTHGTPQNTTLKINLWGTATGSNSGSGNFNTGRIRVSVTNITMGAGVSLEADWNDGLGVWQWTLTDQFLQQTTGSTANGFNEGLYEEILGSQVGDVIVVSVRNDLTGNCNVSGTQQWTSTAGGWFEVIGQ